MTRPPGIVFVVHVLAAAGGAVCLVRSQTRSPVRCCTWTFACAERCRSRPDKRPGRSRCILSRSAGRCWRSRNSSWTSRSARRHIGGDAAVELYIARPHLRREWIRSRVLDPIQDRLVVDDIVARRVLIARIAVLKQLCVVVARRDAIAEEEEVSAPIICWIGRPNEEGFAPVVRANGVAVDRPSRCCRSRPYSGYPPRLCNRCPPKSRSWWSCPGCH